MTARNESVEGRNLYCERGGRAVLQDLSFDCHAGTPLVVTGPNGAGKSTLLRLVAGFLKPSQGRLSFALGVEVYTSSPPEQLHYIGHLDGIKPALSVREHMMFWAQYLGTPGSAAAVVVTKALAHAGLSHLGDLPGGMLSAGQKRRVALTRLLLHRRPLWLLDEPTVTLDAAARTLLVQMMADHCAGGGLLMVTSHDALALPGAALLKLDAAQNQAA